MLVSEQEHEAALQRAVDQQAAAHGGQEALQRAEAEADSSSLGAALLGAAAGGLIAGPVGALAGAVSASYAAALPSDADSYGVGGFMRQTGAQVSSAIVGGQQYLQLRVRATSKQARHYGKLSKWEPRRGVLKSRRGGVPGTNRPMAPPTPTARAPIRTAAWLLAM